MRIERRKLSELNPAEYNPRVQLQAGDRAYEDIKRSIEVFGLVEPLVWNETTGNLVGGHQRLRIMQDMGIEDADVSIVQLDIEHEKALNVALNKLDGEWDRDSLRSLLGSMAMDVRELTGFDVKELKALDPKTLSASPQLEGMTYSIVIECKDEHEQADMLARFEDEGIACRALIS
jgi:ParB-like chromosome segregation protein Spo0J